MVSVSLNLKKTCEEWPCLFTYRTAEVSENGPVMVTLMEEPFGMAKSNNLNV